MSIFTNIVPTKEEIKTNYGFIYVTVNLINNKIYVGQKKFDKNWKFYLGSGAYFKKSISKNGKENFKKYIIELCSNGDINSREVYWIAKLNAMDKTIGYNLCEGGGTANGFKHSESAKTKMSIAKKGMQLWLGKTHSEESKQKISDAKKGRILSESHKKKVGDALRGDKNYKTKNIQCFKDGEMIWEGRLGAIKIKELGFIPNCVYKCCSGERKTHKGHTFKYKE